MKPLIGARKMARIESTTSNAVNAYHRVWYPEPVYRVSMEPGLGPSRSASALFGVGLVLGMCRAVFFELLGA